MTTYFCLCPIDYSPFNHLLSKNYWYVWDREGFFEEHIIIINFWILYEKKYTYDCQIKE